MIMETLKFKVGDKVRVKSLEWYNGNKDANGLVYIDEQGVVFDKTMANLCEKIVQIEEVNSTGYFIKEYSGFFEDWMFEDEVVEDIKKRILTKEVAQAVVRCTKYIIKNENENANLQKKLFEIGCKWASGGKEVANEDCKYLYVDKNLNITFGDVGEENFYKKEPSAELSVNDILNIEIKDITMETKLMTQKEVFEYLNNTKILCTSTDKTAKVQEKLFEFGIEWHSGARVHSDTYLLFIEDKKIEFTHDIEAWVISNKKQIEPSEILSIKLKEEKPKFDFCTLKPFDKVIVKDNGCTWRCNFFSHKEEDRFYCVLSTWEKCIPYNDETKHLVGTTEDAPEFYLI